jgi:hypothetical protein
MRGLKKRRGAIGQKLLCRKAETQGTPQGTRIVSASYRHMIRREGNNKDHVTDNETKWSEMNDRT